MHITCSACGYFQPSAPACCECGAILPVDLASTTDTDVLATVLGYLLMLDDDVTPNIPTPTTHAQRVDALNTAGWTFNPMDRDQTIWAYERLTGQVTA